MIGTGDSSLAPFTAPGTYSDHRGVEHITWSISPYVGSSRRPPGFEIATTIRGVPVGGFDFDALEPVDPEQGSSGLVTLDEWRNVTACVLAGTLPTTVERDGRCESTTVDFELDLRTAETLVVRCTVDGRTFESTDGWFEDALAKLGRTLPPGVALACCVTCSFSDYSPAGHGLTGMSCHRGAKEQYLQVRAKRDYWSVPITEAVMETHRCSEWAPRTPGTGHRG